MGKLGKIEVASTVFEKPLQCSVRKDASFMWNQADGKPDMFLLDKRRMVKYG